MTRLIYQPAPAANLELKDADWAQIEKAACTTFDYDARDKIAAMLEAYLDHAAIIGAAVRPGKIRPQLEAVGRRANALAKAIKKIAGDSEDANGQPTGRWIRQRALVRRVDPPDLGAIMRSVAALSTSAAAAARELPRDIGAPGNPAIVSLILGLLDEFKRAGGGGHYTAPAVAFLQSACALVGVKLQRQQLMALIKKSVWLQKVGFPSYGLSKKSEQSA